jgi:hypothetical protein
MIDELILRFRTLDMCFNPPLSPQASEALERSLACKLSADVIALYRDHDGSRVDAPGIWPLHLMSAAEAIEFHRATGNSATWAWTDVRALWTDHQSNYAGVYVQGPLEGRVCILDHEEPDLSPVYRSIPSFLESLLESAAGDADWQAMPTDYPVDRGISIVGEKPATAADRDMDWVTAQSLVPQYRGARNEDEKRYLAYSIMALTPPDRVDTLLEFLEDDDMWTQERACWIFGRRKYQPAVGRLAVMALRGQHNGQIKAILVLGRIGSPECKDHLTSLARELPPAYQIYVEHALRESERGGAR